MNYTSSKSLYKKIAVATLLAILVMCLFVCLNLFAQVVPEISIPQKNATSSQNFNSPIINSTTIYEELTSKSDHVQLDVKLIETSGIPYPVRFVNRTIASASISFWLHPIFATFVVWLAITALYIGRIKRYLIINVVAAMFLALHIILSVSTFDRYWDIDPTLIYWAFYLSDFCLRLFIFCTIYILWNQPYKLFKNSIVRHLPWAVLASLIFPWFLQTTKIVTNFSLTITTSLLSCSLFIMIAAYRQWRGTFLNSENVTYLVNQIVMRWLVATTTICTAFSLVINMLDLFNMVDSLATYSFNACVAIIFMIGVTALLLRTQLYKIESLWWQAWGLLGAVSIALMLYTAFLILKIELSDIVIMIIVMCTLVAYYFIGMLYKHHFASQESNIMQQVIPQLVDVVAYLSNPKLAHNKWCEILIQTFRPKIIINITSRDVLRTNLISTGTNQQHGYGIKDNLFSSADSLKTLDNNQPVHICNNGASMLVLGFNDEKVLLQGAAHGMRLFNKLDATRVLLLWRIASQGQMAQSAYLKGESSEREQIAADLHDNIGRKLLSIISLGGDHNDYAKDTLQNLNMLTKGLYVQSLSVIELLVDINYYFAQSCEFRSIGYHTDISVQPIQDIVPSSQSATFLNALINELLRNALQHNQTTQIFLTIEIVINDVIVTIVNDGEITDPTTWQLGLGIVSIKRRIDDLEGDIAWTSVDAGGVTCQAIFNLKRWLAL